MRLNSFLTLSLLFIVLFFVQCNKNQTTGSTLNTGNQVTTTICGLVLDENGMSIENALVVCNGKNTMTNQQGIFILNHIATLENKTDIEITKEGYFKSYKTILVKQGQSQIIKAVLLKKENPVKFYANVGGTINFGNQLSFVFPANALVDKLSGLEYTGQVAMVVKYIDPTTENGLMSMPGNLTGLDSNQNEKILTSYGMLVAELVDLAGNQLQIKPNVQVQMTMEIPATMQSSALPTIPLWYFDEIKAIWVEEGSGNLVGNKYVGFVNHFSFWNYDIPKNLIKLEMTILDQYNQPVSGYEVRLTNLSNNSQSNGFTDALGWVGGFVPINENLKLDIMSTNYCSNISLLTKSISTSASNQNLGNIILNTFTFSTCQLKGKLVNCNQAPVSNGMIYLKDITGFIFTDNQGDFSIDLPCTPTSSILLYCYDLNSNQFDSLEITPSSGINNLGTIVACGMSGKYLNLNIKNLMTQDTLSRVYSSILNGLMCSYHPSLNEYNFHILSASNESDFILESFYVNGIGTYTNNNISFKLLSINKFNEDWDVIPNSGALNITSINSAPSDVTGNFQLLMKGKITNNNYLFSGDFRVPILK